jgi:hypothetical protein
MGICRVPIHIDHRRRSIDLSAGVDPFRLNRLLRSANAIVKQIRRGVLPPSHPSARIYPQVGEGVWRVKDVVAGLPKRVYGN